MSDLEIRFLGLAALVCWVETDYTFYHGCRLLYLGKYCFLSDIADVRFGLCARVVSVFIAFLSFLYVPVHGRSFVFYFFAIFSQ